MWRAPCVPVNVARRLRLGTQAWGALGPRQLLAVRLSSRGASALLAARDVGGCVVLLLRGSEVRHVLGLDEARWTELEQMARDSGLDLFYRPFKNGINEDLPAQIKLFYLLCEYHQGKDLLFVSYKRVPNVRKGEKAIPFLEVLECSRPTPKLIYQYQKMCHLENETSC